jgi:asparagine synthase (glutamine-hydrolysing)
MSAGSGYDDRSAGIRRRSSDFIVSVDLRTLEISGSSELFSAGSILVALTGYADRCRPGSHEGDRTAAGDEHAAALALAYLRWGSDAAKHLLGQYAAVVIDKVERSVVLVQDSIGLRTAFYTLRGDVLTVAARLDDLVALFGMPPIDERYVAELLGSGGPSIWYTPFVGFEMLACGQTIRFRAGSRTVMRPWSPPVSEPAHTSKPGNAVEIFRRLIDEATAAALPRNGRVLCKLSGGLDSTTVLASAHAIRNDIEAFTYVGGPDSRDDDEVHARLAVSALGLRWHVVDIDTCPPYGELPRTFGAMPWGETHVAALRRFREVIAREGFTVVLTGMGGDVVLGGPGVRPHHLADAILAGHWIRAFRTIRRWQKRAPNRRGWTHWFAHYALRSAWRHLAGRTLDTPRAMAAVPDWVNPAFAKRHDLCARARRQWAPRVKRPGAQYLWQEIYAVAGLLAIENAVETSTEFRHPLLYRPLLEFMCALDESLRRPADDDRVLHRLAAAGRLPEEIRLRRTKGSDQQQCQRALMHSEIWYRMLVDEPRIVAHGWVDQRKWRLAVDRARFGVTDSLQHFNIAMTLECWLRTMEQFGPKPKADARAAPAQLVRPSG